MDSKSKTFHINLTETWKKIFPCPECGKKIGYSHFLRQVHKQFDDSPNAFYYNHCSTGVYINYEPRLWIERNKLKNK